MVYRGDDASDEEAKLVGREYDVKADSLKSSKADNGRGCCLVFVQRAPRVCALILGLTMLYAVPICNVRFPGLLARALRAGPYQKNSGEITAIITALHDGIG
jgi:hypothetical protein